MGYDAYFTLLIVSILTAVVLAIFFWRRRPAPGATAMVGLLAVTAVWAVGYMIEVLTDTLAGRELAEGLQYIGIVSVPVLWFVFAARFTGYENWLSRHLYLLAIIPGITLVLVWTGAAHSLMWYDWRLETFGEFLVTVKSYGPWFFFHAAYSYLLVVGGFAMIFLRLFHPLNLFQNQIIVLIIAALLPLVWNVIFVFRAAPTYHIDMTPPAFIVSGAAIALGLFRFRMLDIVPIARDSLVESMDDGVIVLDKQDRFLDLNHATRAVVGYSASELVGRPASMLWSGRPELEEFFHSDRNSRTEAVFAGSGGQRYYYELSITPLYDRRRNVTGRLIIMRDITERKKAEEELGMLSHRIMNLQEEERAAISRELHDHVGQELAVLGLTLHRGGSLPDCENAVNNMEAARDQVRKISSDLRNLASSLHPSMLETLGLLPTLVWYLDDFGNRTGIDIRFEHSGLEAAGMPAAVKLAAYRIVQEALTNVVPSLGSTSGIGGPLRGWGSAVPGGH
ncbi:MAG: PAS domain S-box protein [Dehalococcoidia bacterium]|nr:PAS domain S-box protein [Dehalococcoidia bacterium]